MNEQHFMLTVYSNFYKGYSVHAEYKIGNENFSLLHTQIEDAAFGASKLYLYANDRMVQEVNLSHSASCCPGSGQCGSLRCHHEIRCSGCHSCCVFCDRTGIHQRNLGAEYLDLSDAADCFYGASASSCGP